MACCPDDPLAQPPHCTEIFVGGAGSVVLGLKCDADVARTPDDPLAQPPHGTEVFVGGVLGRC